MTNIEYLLHLFQEKDENISIIWQSEENYLFRLRYYICTPWMWIVECFPTCSIWYREAIIFIQNQAHSMNLSNMLKFSHSLLRCLYKKLLFSMVNYCWFPSFPICKAFWSAGRVAGKHSWPDLALAIFYLAIDLALATFYHESCL